MRRYTSETSDPALALASGTPPPWGYDRWLESESVLVVDECVQDATRYQRLLAAAGAIVTTAPDVRQARDLLQQRADFDVKVIDVEASGDPGFSLAREMRKRKPGCALLFVSRCADAHLVRQVKQLGAAFLSKSSSEADFMFTMSRLVHLDVPSISALTALARKCWALSPQQTRLLYYNLWSLSNEEIAEVLQLSLHTVQEYQQHLRRKTGARTKAGYLRRLLECTGTIPPSTPPQPVAPLCPSQSNGNREPAVQGSPRQS